MRETLLSLLDSEGPPAPGAVVTDMGSVKGSVVAELEPLCAARGLRFVGSHPMAGSEQKEPNTPATRFLPARPAC